MHIRQRLCFVKSREKEKFLFILIGLYAASGPLHYSLHLYRVLCNNAGLLWSYRKHFASEATRIVIKYQLCFQL